MGLLFWLSHSAYSQQELLFSPNMGQWDNPSVARCVFQGGAFFLRKDGFRIKLLNKADLPNVHKAFHYRGIDTQFTLHGHVLDCAFQNHNPIEKIEVLYEDEAVWYENYFLGNNPDKWVTEVYPVRRIRLKNVYPNIDFVAYTKGEEVEFDWIVNPGASPADIKLTINGQDSLSWEGGAMHAHTSVGDFEMNKPLAYQGQTPVECGYMPYGHGHSFGFNVWNMQWDKTKPLIIDPVLVFSTYSGSRGDNFGYTATYDTGGHLYAGGIVDTLQGAYPVTMGAFQFVYGGRGPVQAPVWLPCDASLSKYKPDGSALVWASYLGGTSNEYPHSLGLDEKNNLLVFGTTLSRDFPVSKPTAYDTTHAAKHDIFVVKISADGKQLLAGTYLGGNSDDGINNGALHFNYADDFRGDIISDVNGNIYVASCTRSAGFPVTPNAAQTAYNGGLESVVVSLNSDLSVLRWSTFVGGSGDDAAYSLKLDNNDNIIVGGATSSLDFPTKGTVLHSSFQGGNSDGYVLKLTSDSGKMLESTYWGTDEYDQIYFVDLDEKNKIYITGQTAGTINRTPGTYGKNGTTQFIGRLTNDLDATEFITTFGNRTGTPELSPCAFLVDKCYNIYFSGWGSFVGIGNAGTTQGLEVTPNAFQKTTDNNDFYLIVLNRDAKNLVYATYFGGDSSEDHVDGGTSRFDKRGVIYQSVCSSCPNNPPGLNDFPTTPGSAFPVNVSYRCSNASFKFDFNITYAVEANFTAAPRKICNPDTIFFYQTSIYGKKFKWTFGDGGTSSALNPYHIYTSPGKYTVTLVVIDSGSCNVTDTHSLVVEVLPGPDAKISYNYDPCASKVAFKITGNNFNNLFVDLGDGTTQNSADFIHNYIPGNYTVKAVFAHPTSGCKDSISKNIAINKDSSQEIFLANVFTPNGDTKNECFRVYGLSKDCDAADLKIFNRWGELIFHTDDLTECWNGRVNNTGVEVPEATYFYQILVYRKGSKKTDKVISGSINLIR